MGFSGVETSLDHVLSNFTYNTGPCVRQSAGIDFDHKYTVFEVAGFESGQLQYRMLEDLIDYPDPGTTNPIAEPFPALNQTLVATSRFGVLLRYTAITSPSQNLQGQLVVAVPDGLPVSLTMFNYRCNPYPPVTITPPLRVLKAAPAGQTTAFEDIFFRTPKLPSNWCL